MYKATSRSLQRMVEPMAPKPTGGAIGLSFDHDFIPSAQNMSEEECRSERSRLMIELTRAQNELLASKVANDRTSIEGLGLRIAAYGSRLSLINKRLAVLARDEHSQRLGDAVRELCPPDLARRIFDRCKEMQTQPPK